MSNLLTDEIREILKPSQDTLIITIGNSLRSDDGVGVYIGEKISNIKNYKVINAYNKPENVIDNALELKPKKVVIIDAADFNGKAGDAKIINEGLIPQVTFSTHTFPIPILVKILEKDLSCKVIFLGIQTKSLDFKEELSEEVRRTADEIIKCLKCT